MLSSAGSLPLILAWSGLGWGPCQEPATQPCSLTWVAGTQSVQPSQLPPRTCAGRKVESKNKLGSEPRRLVLGYRAVGHTPTHSGTLKTLPRLWHRKTKESQVKACGQPAFRTLMWAQRKVKVAVTTRHCTTGKKAAQRESPRDHRGPHCILSWVLTCMCA